MGTPVDRDGKQVSTEASTRGTALARLRALEAVATDILSHLDLEATLLSAMNAAVDLLGADIAGILLAEENGDLRMRACRGHRSIQSMRLVARRGQGVAGKVFETGMPCRVDNYPDASISTHFQDLAELEEARSALGCPMIVRGEVIGTVMAWSRRPVAFTSTDEEVLGGVASLATIAIENARLYDIERTAVRTLEEANLRLQQQYELLSRAFIVHEELTDLVLSGGRLQELVETVARHTGGDVVVLDADLEPLAIMPGARGVAVRARRHLKETRRYLPGVISRDAMLEPSGKWDSWLLIRPAAAGGDILGFLCVSLEHQPGELDPVIVEQAGTVCALALTKERAVLDAHTRVLSDFVWDLLDGNIDEEAEAIARCRYLGYVMPVQPRVVLISIEGLVAWARESAADTRAVDRRRNALVASVSALASGHGLHRPMTARRGPLIALIIPSDRPAAGDSAWRSWPEDAVWAKELAEHVVHGLAEANSDLKFAAGVSSPSAAQTNLRKARDQAESALASVMPADATQPVALFDSLGVLRLLLAPGDREELVDFAHAVLGPVLDYQTRYSTNLMETLETFLAHDCSLQFAARQLRLHPKTVRYRLNRIEQLTNRDLSSQKDRFDAQLALTIIHALALKDAHR